MLKSALALFEKRGYPAVSLDDILEDAGAYKKSLYTYFPAKADLGRAYLQAQTDRFVGFLEHLASRHRNFESFWKAWMRFVKAEAKQGRYTGCPFANFAGQLAAEVAPFRTELTDLVTRWRGLFSEFLRRTSQTNLSQEEAEDLSDRLMMAYEGAVQLYRISADAAYFTKLQSEGMRIYAHALGMKVTTDSRFRL